MHRRPAPGTRAIASPARRLALAAALSAATLWALPAQAQDPSPRLGTITMEGQGQVTVAPDMAVITARVVTLGETAADALSGNTADLAKVIEKIKASGIEAKDIQTSGFAIYPRYEQVNGNSGRQPEIIGYEVRNGVDVNVRDLTKLGSLLTGVVESGANAVDGIRFQVSDPEEKLDEARKQAVAAARHKAGIFAQAAGVELAGILSISETGIQMPRPLMMRAEGLMMAKADALPIEAGEETISASVTIQWQISAGTGK